MGPQRLPLEVLVVAVVKMAAWAALGHLDKVMLAAAWEVALVLLVLVEAAQALLAGREQEQIQEQVELEVMGQLLQFLAHL